MASNNNLTQPGLNAAGAAAAGIHVMPVYDLQGRPLGFFPLAPGVDPGVLQQGAIASILPHSAAPVARIAPRSPAAAHSAIMASSSPLASLPFPGAVSAGANENAARSAALGSSAKPAGALGVEAAIEAGKASLLAAFERSYGGPGPGSASGGHSGPPTHASPRAPREAKDARSAPKDLYVTPTPSVQVAGGDVGVPSGNRTVTGQALVPVRAFVGEAANESSSTLESKVAGTGPAAEVYIYSLESSADALAELQEARTAFETRIKELEKKMKNSTQRATLLEQDLQEAYRELDGKEAEVKAMKAAERAASRRPDLVSVLTGSLPGGAGGGLLGLSGPGSSAQLRSSLAPLLAQSSAVDRARLYELLRRVGPLASLPDSLLWESLHHSRLVRLPIEGVLAQAPGKAAENALLIVVDGLLSTGSNASSGGTGAALGPGSYMCEHNILGRLPGVGRDPASWLAITDVLLLAVPAELLRRFLLSECALLDCWSESGVALLLAPTYTPNRPPPRSMVHADADATALNAHVALHAALRHVATGGHVKQVLEAMDSAARARSSRGAGSWADSGTAGISLAVGDDDDDESGDAQLGQSEGVAPRLSAVDRAIASIPSHLAQNAPLLMHLLTAALPGIPTDKMLDFTVQAAGRFFDAAGAALIELDTSAVLLQEQMAALYGGFTAAKLLRGGASAASPVLVHRIVPPYAVGVLNQSTQLAGLAAICCTTGSLLNIRDTAVDTRFNEKLEPVAGPIGARTLLYVPIFVTLPSTGNTSAGEREGSRQLCGVLQLVDKRRDTSRYFPPVSLRDDEESAPGSVGTSSVPLAEEDVTVLDRGVIARGEDGKPRYVFTARDEELAELVARRIGDIISASLRQAVLSEAGSPPKTAGTGEEEEKEGGGDASGLALHGSTVVGLGEAPVVQGAPHGANNVKSSATTTQPSAPRIVAQHTVTDLVQCRVRSMHAFMPLALLAAPAADSDSYADYGIGSPDRAGAAFGSRGASANRPPTSVLNLGDDSEGLEGGREGMDGGLTGPGLSTSALGRAGGDEFGALPPCLSLLPSQLSLYVYVRAVLVLGRSTITPDVSSPPARCLNGHVSGRLGNGYVSGGEHAAGAGGSPGEVSTANWGVAVATLAGGAGVSLADDPTEGKGWMDMPARVCDIPRGASLVLAVHEDDGAGPGRALGWASMPLFTPATCTMRMGRHILPLQPGPWPGGALAGAGDECGPRLGLLEVDLGSVGVPTGAVVVDCDAARGSRWWRALGMAAGLKLVAVDGPGLDNAGGLLLAPGRAADEGGEATELLLDPTPDPAAAAAAAAAASSAGGRGAAHMSADGRLIMVSPFADRSRDAARLMASAASAGGSILPHMWLEGQGVDPRHSGPSSLPQLQSGTPSLPLPRPPPTQSGGMGLPSSLLPIMRVSPGVNDLSASDLALARSILGASSPSNAAHIGGSVCDVWSPHHLSPALRRVLWTYRRPLMAAAGATILPLLLKAAPFTTAVPSVHHRADVLSHSTDPILALRAAHALVRSCPTRTMPMYVALQLLDPSFGDPSVRAAGASAAMCSPSWSLLAHAPALALASCAETSLDSPLARLLLSAVVEAPATVGRQLLWAWRSLQGAVGLRARCMRLQRALLDAAEPSMAAQEALQAYGLSQLASACRRGTLAQPIGHRTSALHSLLSCLVLPHTVRLPLRASGAVVPSVYYRSVDDGSLAAAIAEKCTGGDRECAAPAPLVTLPGLVLEPVSPLRIAHASLGETHSSPVRSPLSKPLPMMARVAGGREKEGDEEDDEDDREVVPGEEEEEEEEPRDVIQDVEDGCVLALVQLGVYSDSPAFRLPTDVGSNAASTLQYCREMTSRAANMSGFGRDPRLPTAGTFIRALIDVDGVDSPGAYQGVGEARMPLPYTAQAELAVSRAKAAAEAATALAAQPMSTAQRILASQRGTRVGGGQEAMRTHVVMPRPTGTALPSNGLCVGALQVDACRVLLSAPRKRYSRVLLVFKAARDLDAAEGEGVGVGEDPFPHLVKHDVHVPRPLRWRNNSIHVLAVSGDDTTICVEALHASILNTLARIWREGGLRAGDAAPLYAYGVHAAVSRDPLMSNAVGAGAVTSLSGGSSYVSGMPVTGVPLGALAGDAVGSRLFGLLLAPPFARSLAEILGVGEEADESVPPSIGIGDAFNDGATVRDDAAVVGATRGSGVVSGTGGPGFGRNGLQRWFMANLYGAGDRPNPSGAHANAGDVGAAAVSAQEGQSGQYETICRTFATSLVAAVVGCYVLATGERRPADLLLTPAGHVHLAGLGYTDGMPDRCLHVDEVHAAALGMGMQGQGGALGASMGLGSTARRVESRGSHFASRPVLTELLAAMGGPSTAKPCVVDAGAGAGRAGRLGALSGIQPLVMQLSPLAEAFVRACIDALMAARARAQEFLTLVGAHLPLALPGASTPFDLACMRSRLFLHLPLAEARWRAAHAMVGFLGMDPVSVGPPVPLMPPTTVGPASFTQARVNAAATPAQAVQTPGNKSRMPVDL